MRNDIHTTLHWRFGVSHPVVTCDFAVSKQRRCTGCLHGEAWSGYQSDGETAARSQHHIYLDRSEQLEGDCEAQARRYFRRLLVQARPKLRTNMRLA